MKNRWTEQGAREAVNRWGALRGAEFALRLHTAQLLGQDANLVLHGGGNVSLKGKHRTLFGDEVDAIFVKASGADMASLEPAAMPALDLTGLRKLRALTRLDDAAMVNAFRTHLFDASSLTPSIETLVHAFLPHRYVDHSHADAVLALTNQPDGERRVREALGDRVAIVPYVRPGFDLAKVIADVHEANPQVEGLVLLHHGLITFGDDARAAYERHVELVAACERFLEGRTVGRTLTVAFRAPEDAAALAARAAPILRGLLSLPSGDEDRPHTRSIFEWRGGEEVLTFVNSREASDLAAAGPLTGDHLIHTKPYPLFVADPRWSDASELRRQLYDAVADFRGAYEAYVTAHGGSLGGIDPLPRVVLLPGAGLLARGRTKREARVTADIAEHTLAVKTWVHAIGRYTALELNHLYDMEFRGLQRVKLSAAAKRPLESQVVVISGGAGAIGVGIAEACAQAGAHVVIADLDEKRVTAAVERIEREHGAGTAHGVSMDVTDETGVRRAFDAIARYYGGVDVIVPNAGIAHVAAIENLSAGDFRRVLEVNTVGYLIFMREGVRLLKQQGLGGHVVIISSKNVFGPGKEFGAYSASKAAAHQLGKVAAVELASDGIRVNMINPDAIFGDETTPSGLWAAVGPDRAKSRQLKEQDLAEYYRERSLLKVRVRARHVGNAVVFFAGNATPTTGATLPVDGGVPEAFPR